MKKSGTACTGGQVCPGLAFSVFRVIITAAYEDYVIIITTVPDTVLAGGILFTQGILDTLIIFPLLQIPSSI